jgi:hypothetical protein
MVREFVADVAVEVLDDERATRTTRDAKSRFAAASTWSSRRAGST